MPFAAVASIQALGVANLDLLLGSLDPLDLEFERPEEEDVDLDLPDELPRLLEPLSVAILSGAV